MSTHNIYFGGEMRKILIWIPVLSGATHDFGRMKSPIFKKTKKKKNPKKQMFTVFTLSIWIPQLLTIFVQNLNRYNLLPDVVSKNCWISGKQCRP